MGSKEDANTVQHANNASAIATRYTKTQTDSLFARNTDPWITGENNIRDDMWSPFETIEYKLSAKIVEAR
jgi:hypothetical protein